MMMILDCLLCLEQLASTPILLSTASTATGKESGIVFIRLIFYAIYMNDRKWPHAKSMANLIEKDTG